MAVMKTMATLSKPTEKLKATSGFAVLFVVFHRAFTKHIMENHLPSEKCRFHSGNNAGHPVVPLLGSMLTIMFCPYVCLSQNTYVQSYAQV
ncbi:hypothetical protein M513_12310 [Trichuris suis]|uniref:Uncharacterized protein n=1 Tax=Trichuris suis TaxID=68888 RepID=A0A085LPD1_9BILA|nr:hypothetical protein M513_12310 [Trichuris suis]